MHFCSDAYFAKSEFCDSQIIEMPDKLSKELKSTCEIPTFKKLELLENHPRNAMCTRKNTLVVRIMKPKAIVSMLSTASRM